MVESRAGTFKGRELQERVVQINRVAKVVKGGRRFSFTALVVVGDEIEHVGMGHGKANEVPVAIEKAIEQARRSMVRIHKVGGTIPHQVIGHFGAGRVLLKPASEGTGVIAGAGVRAVLELGGVKDVLSKCLGTRTPINMVRATMDALAQLRPVEDVASDRGLTVDQVLGPRLAAAVRDGRAVSTREEREAFSGSATDAGSEPAVEAAADEPAAAVAASTEETS